MSNEVFKLTAVIRELDNAIELSEVLGIFEISALDETERKWRSTLQRKAKAILEDSNLAPAMWLHRRRIVAAVELDSVEMTFEPSRRAPDWQEPVRLSIGFVRWEEDELHHAFVPALGLHVFATRANLLPDRVEEHVRLMLASRGKYLSLAQLAELSRVKALRLGSLEVDVARKTPKQIAAAGEITTEKPSMLAKLAEELSPTMPRPGQPTLPRTDPPPHPTWEMDAELAQLVEILSGPHRRSVLLVGPAGCGKSALVRELARRRSEFGFGHTPFWSTSGARLMTGPIGFGMWQDRCQEMCREAAKTKAIVNFGNLRELLEVGKASRGEQSVGSFLRPWIARGDVLSIAECTPEQLGAIERDEPHLLAAFQPMTIPERTPEQTRIILNRAFEHAPGQASLDIAGSNAALDRMHQLHLRYTAYSARPGRVLRFLKNILAQRFPEKVISEAEVIEGFSRETGLPLVLLDDRVTLDLERTRDWFVRRVIGQPQAVDHVLDLLARVKARLARPHRPLSSFVFIGPTGTGKTELAKALAEFLFADAARLVRFDLNEFSDPISVQRLIGGPAVGSAEGLLTARVREQPFSVVLLDEFEKADPSFFDLLLQVLGDGRLTDASGRVADFCNSVIVMTSNLGAQQFQRGTAGFRSEGAAAAEAQEHFSDAVRKFLRPEIFNRLDAVVPFRALTPEIVLEIARLHLDRLRQRDGLRLRGVECDILPEVAEHLAAGGYDVRYGARPLKRAIERELLVPLAGALNRYEKDTLLAAQIGLRDGRIQVDVRARTQDSDRAKTASTQELGSLVVGKRRQLVRLQNCAATRKLENDLVMLETLERRAAAAKWKSPELQARLGLLPKLRECLSSITKLIDRSKHLETEALGMLYQRESLDPVLLDPELAVLERERQKLVRDVFRLTQDRPDEAVLAFFGEPHAALLEFAAVYFRLAAQSGKVEALDYYLPPPGGRSNTSVLLRQTPKKLEEFFVSPPENIVGVVMHVRGDLILPQFRGEAGMHIITEKKAERLCLIEVVSPPFSDYAPPKGIERSGAIKAKGVNCTRLFDRESNEVADSKFGVRPWHGLGLEQCVAALIEDRLKMEMEVATS